MNAMTMNQKPFTPVPPDKGSFPLDHEGKCKLDMLHYMRCLIDTNNDAVACKNLAKTYLQCRMENNLMAKEDWSKLGFESDDKPVNSSS